jgi:hypothetical protein
LVGDESDTIFVGGSVSGFDVQIGGIVAGVKPVDNIGALLRNPIRNFDILGPTIDSPANVGSNKGLFVLYTAAVGYSGRTLRTGRSLRTGGSWTPCGPSGTRNAYRSW